MDLESLLVIIFGVLFVMLLIWLFFQSFIVLYKSYQSYNWKTTTAKITSSSIEEKTDQDGINYKANISYRYVVDGTEYNSDNVAFIGILYMSRKVANFQCSQFPLDSSSRVYYNPNNHSESVLIPGFTRLQIPSAAFFTIVVITVIYLLLNRLGAI